MQSSLSARFRVRPARENDLPAMSDLLSALFSLEVDFTPDRVRQRRGLSALLNAGERACVLVAEERGQVIGMVACQVLTSTAEGGDVGLVEDVVVDGRYRGLGVGRVLLDEIERWAADRKLLRLQLLAERTNDAASAFYERMGWKPTRLVAWRRQPIRVGRQAENRKT